MLPRFLIALFFILGLPLPYTAQTVQLRYAPPVDFPAPVDSNSPAYWIGDTLYIFNSIGMPERSDGYDQFTLGDSIAARLDNRLRTPLWIEAVWLDDDHTLYAWYHHEPV